MYNVLLILCGIEAIYDVKTKHVHTLIWGSVAVGCIFWNIVHNEKNLQWILTATLVGIFLIVCSKILRGGIGLGDGIVFLTLGLGLGMKSASCILFYSLVLCCVWGIIQILRKKYSRTDELPFLPFVFMGMIWNQIMLYLYL